MGKRLGTRVFNFNEITSEAVWPIGHTWRSKWHHLPWDCWQAGRQTTL